jgi:hypothetical protein
MLSMMVSREWDMGQSGSFRLSVSGIWMVWFRYWGALSSCRDGDGDGNGRFSER